MSEQPILAVHERMSEQHAPQKALSRSNKRKRHEDNNTNELHQYFLMRGKLGGLFVAVGLLSAGSWFVDLVLFIVVATVAFSALIAVMVYEKSRAKRAVHTTTVFYEQGIDEHIQFERKPEFRRYKRYNEIAQVVETHVDFLIVFGTTPEYIPRGLVVPNKIILLKRNMHPDQINELRALFARKFGEQFKGVK